MPFNHKGNFAFTEEAIKRVAPLGSGVYGLHDTNRWIYVGETNSLERRLLEHLNETNTCISRSKPTQFVWEESMASERVRRQNQLILELTPTCNQKLG